MDLTPFVVSGIAVGGVYALSGLGLVVLYRATGVLNFACGAISAASAMIAWQLVDSGVPHPLAYGAGVLIAVTLSLGYGLLVNPATTQRPPVVRAVATLGAALTVLGLMLAVWTDDPRSTTLPTDNVGFLIGSVRVTGTQVMSLALAVVTTAICGWTLGRTWLGAAMRGLADDREVASLAGVPIARIETISWGFSGFLAGVTGILLADLVATDPTTLTFLVIAALAAAAIGGFRSLSFTLAGGIGVGVLQGIATPFDLTSPFRTAVPFLAAILALLAMKSRSGLHGRAA